MVPTEQRDCEEERKAIAFKRRDDWGDRGETQKIYRMLIADLWSMKRKVLTL